jgi:hypothetical protein
LKQIQALRRLVLLHPVRDGLVVTLDRPPGGALTAPAHLAEEPPDMTGVVDDPGVCLDHLGHTLERPHVGGTTVGQRSLREPAFDLAKVDLVELGKATGPARRSKCGCAFGLPLRVPPAHALAGYLELTGHVRLALSLVEQSRRLLAPALHSVEVPSNARSDRHHGQMEKTRMMGRHTVSHHSAPLSPYYTSLFNVRLRNREQV